VSSRLKRAPIAGRRCNSDEHRRVRLRTRARSIGEQYAACRRAFSPRNEISWRTRSKHEIPPDRHRRSNSRVAGKGRRRRPDRPHGKRTAEPRTHRQGCVRSTGQCAMVKVWCVPVRSRRGRPKRKEPPADANGKIRRRPLRAVAAAEGSPRAHRSHRPPSMMARSSARVAGWAQASQTSGSAARHETSTLGSAEPRDGADRRRSGRSLNYSSLNARAIGRGSEPKTRHPFVISMGGGWCRRNWAFGHDSFPRIGRLTAMRAAYSQPPERGRSASDREGG